MTLPSKKEKPKGRDTKVISCTGTTGTGKSYKAREIAKKLGGNGKVLVITYNGSGDTWDDCKKIEPTEKALSFKKGWRKIHFVEHESELNPLEEIYNYYRNGVLILDDCSLYMQSNWSSTKGLKQICVDHRFNGLDIIFIGHSPMHIPRQCWAYIKASFIFKCTSKLEKSSMPLDNFEAFLEKQNYVNKWFDQEEVKLRTKPRGLYQCIIT